MILGMGLSDKLENLEENCTGGRATVTGKTESCQESRHTNRKPVSIDNDRCCLLLKLMLIKKIFFCSIHATSYLGYNSYTVPPHKQIWPWIHGTTQHWASCQEVGWFPWHLQPQQRSGASCLAIVTPCSLPPPPQKQTLPRIMIPHCT